MGLLDWLENNPAPQPAVAAPQISDTNMFNLEVNGGDYVHGQNAMFSAGGDKALDGLYQMSDPAHRDPDNPAEGDNPYLQALDLHKKTWGDE